MSPVDIFSKIYKKNVDSTEVCKFTNDLAAAINKVCEHLSEPSQTEMEAKNSTSMCTVQTCLFLYKRQPPKAHYPFSKTPDNIPTS